MPANKVFSVGRVGCNELKSTSKHWPCLFPQHGPGEALDRLEVAWRFSRRNTISVAGKEAVERLDHFVGPKY